MGKHSMRQRASRSCTTQATYFVYTPQIHEIHHCQFVACRSPNGCACLSHCDVIVSKPNQIKSHTQQSHCAIYAQTWHARRHQSSPKHVYVYVYVYMKPAARVVWKDRNSQQLRLIDNEQASKNKQWQCHHRALRGAVEAAAQSCTSTTSTTNNTINVKTINVKTININTSTPIPNPGPSRTNRMSNHAHASSHPSPSPSPAAQHASPTDDTAPTQI
jgi:hypothetical protein